MREPKLQIHPGTVKIYYEEMRAAMRNMNPEHTPSSHPDFDPETREPVWYLCHPLATDEHYTFQENVAHVKKMMRLCFDAGFRVVAPYLSIIEILDDDNHEHRRIGLETDCVVAYSLGRIISCGHRMSTGMSHEWDAVQRRVDEWMEQHGHSSGALRDILEANVMLDLTEWPDRSFVEQLKQFHHSR